MTGNALDTIIHSVTINASPEKLYDMLADVTRMGEWSSACTGAIWDEGSGPTATENAWFTGHNLMGGHAYDTHCQITAAQRPTTIAWMQGGREGIAEWRYQLAPVEHGSEVTEVMESWTLIRPFPPDVVDKDSIPGIRTAFDTSIRETLSRLKSAAEKP